MKTALYLGRFQPFHLGHLEAVKTIDEASDVGKLIIGIGSAQYSGNRRKPFTAEEREEMIRGGLNISKPYDIVHVADIHDAPGWAKHVKSLAPNFDVFFTESEFDAGLFRKAGCEVRMLERFFGISATQILKQMIKGENWQAHVPDGVARYIASIKGAEKVRKFDHAKILDAITE